MKCNVCDCVNEDWKGAFDGNLCKPCHDELLEVLEEKVHSQARRNMQTEAKAYLRKSAHFKVDKEWGSDVQNM